MPIITQTLHGYPFTRPLSNMQYMTSHNLRLVCWSLTSLCHSNGHIETMPAREINPFTCPDQDSIPVAQDTMIDEQSSASGHDYASDRSAIGAAPHNLRNNNKLLHKKLNFMTGHADGHWINFHLDQSRLECIYKGPQNNLQMYLLLPYAISFAH